MTDNPDQPTVAWDDDDPSNLQGSARSQQQIGPYHLLRRIGQGGMGEVILAQQEEPIRRQVALKLIKIGMDTKRVIARFDAERQALALMDHPSIAKVLDAGATEQGRPYFVMEYVPGISITDYCDQHNLSIRDRLQLFVRVCEGVQHAHQKAIIHRDLKPSNILVYEQDGHAVPKIIDFGIAKATAERPSEETMLTELGQMIGTPEYMSPEQADVGVDAVDTRTDIYSLGVVLYELLVGALPFDSTELRRGGFVEIQRRIRQDTPSRPSVRLSTLSGRSTESAARRRTDVPRLQSQLRGDLDWITMKAMEKDRARRYETANGLANDIRRYLDNQPVSATPPSAGYRLHKFVQRHRGGVAAAAAILVVLIGGVVVSTALYLRAGREAERARIQAARSEQVSAFMKTMLEGVGPAVALGRDTKLLREILDNTSKRLETQLADQPEVRAELLAVLGNTYREMGEFAVAEPHLDEVLAMQRTLHGDRDPKTLEAAAAIGTLYYGLGRFEAADSILTAIGDIQEEVLGANDPATLSTRGSLVSVLAYEGRFEEAVDLGEATLDPLIESVGVSNTVTQTVMYTMAQLYADQGAFPRAESLYVRMLDLSRTNVIEEARALPLQTAYGWMLRLAQRLPEAESNTKEALAGLRRVFGNEHAETQIAINNMGIILNDLGKVAEAEPYYIESIELGKRTLGAKHPETVVSMVNLGSFYGRNGRHAEANVVLTEAIAIFRETMPPDHIGLGIALASRGESRAGLGQTATALQDYLAGYEILSKQHDATHPRLRRLIESIAKAYERLGDPSRAAEWRAKLSTSA